MRGKQATSSEARRAREEAESEAVAGRRKIVQLTEENRGLRETLAQERVASTERQRKLVALMNEGASPEVEALRSQLRQAQHDRDGIRQELAGGLSKLLRINTGDVGDFIKAALDYLDVPLHEHFSDFGWGTRRDRRTTHQKARANEDSARQRIKGRPSSGVF